VVHDALRGDGADAYETGSLIEFSGAAESRHKFGRLSNGRVDLVEVAGKSLLRYTLGFKREFYIPLSLGYVFVFAVFYMSSNVDLLMAVIGTTTVAGCSWVSFYVGTVLSFESFLRGNLLRASE
jgi:hypothetical protein